MNREYFLKSARIGFSRWRREDADLAALLWGDPRVTRYICASGIFSDGDVSDRLETELRNDREYRVQYWPVFELATGALIGCCGLRPRRDREYEIGFHLRPHFWGRGYATEAARTVVEYAFGTLRADGLFAGHNPNNAASRRVLLKLGFDPIGEEFYPPTGLYHPSYSLKPERRDRPTD